MNDGHISKNIDLVNIVIELVAARCLSPGGLPKYSAKCTQTERDGWNAMANFSRTRPKSGQTAHALASTNSNLGKPRQTLLKMELKIHKTYQCWHVTIFLAGFQTAFPCLVYSTEESESRVDDGAAAVWRSGGAAAARYDGCHWEQLHARGKSKKSRQTRFWGVPCFCFQC